MKKHIFSITEIILSIATIPLWFINIFAGVGHLPDQTTGEIVEMTFHHSMLENIGDLAHPILAYIAIVTALISAIMNTIVLKSPHGKTIKIAANVAFGIAIGLFLILLFLASTVARGY